MRRKPVLSKLEYHLLSRTMDDLEPLNVLYSDIVRDFQGISLRQIIEALVRLTDIGLVQCYFDDYELGKRIPCEKLTKVQLEKHCSGRSDDELRSYPEQGGEYEFEASAEGRLEEAREI